MQCSLLRAPTADLAWSPLAQQGVTSSSWELFYIWWPENFKDKNGHGPLLEGADFLVCFVRPNSRFVTLQEKIHQNHIVLIPITICSFFSVLILETAILISFQLKSTPCNTGKVEIPSFPKENISPPIAMGQANVQPCVCSAVQDASRTCCFHLLPHVTLDMIIHSHSRFTCLQVHRSA